MQTFDELLLMKRGGRIIFFGETGYRSQKLVDYFEVSAACRNTAARPLISLCGEHVMHRPRVKLHIAQAAMHMGRGSTGFHWIASDAAQHALCRGSKACPRSPRTTTPPPGCWR